MDTLQTTPTARRVPLNAAPDGFLLIGLLLLYGAGTLFVHLWWITHVWNWQPVNVRLPVTGGRCVSREFCVHRKAAYEVEVDLARDPETEEMDRIRQLGWDWSISSNGKKLIPDRSRSDWTSPNSFGLGTFEAVPGQRYTIQARIRRPTTKLRSLDPHLVVNVSEQDSETWGVTITLLGCLAVFLLLIAVPSLVVGTCRTLQRRHRARQQLDLLAHITTNSPA